jgi:hypothetical protein
MQDESKQQRISAMKTKLSALLLLLGLTACKPPETVPYSKLLDDLTHTDSIALLDAGTV